MRIGVFGDSFSSYLTPNGYNFQNNFWVDLLSNKHNVTNHSLSGTNLYWSYNMLEKYASNYDIALLTVTGPYRFYIPHADSHRVQHAFNINQVERLLAEGTTKFTRKDFAILTILQGFMLKVQNHEQDALHHLLLVEQIKRQFPNVILIPTMHGCLNPRTLFTHGTVDKITTMGDIGFIDLEYYNMKWEDMTMDIRPGHMSSENNVIFSEEILKYLESDRTNTFTIDLSLYKKPTISKNEFIERYFTL